MNTLVQLTMEAAPIEPAVVLRWHVHTYFVTYAPTRARSKTLQHCLLWLNYRHGYELRDHRAIRDAIKDLRRAGELICSRGGVGHWIAESREDVKECTDRELRPKALDLMLTARAMRQAAIHQFGGQRKIFPGKWLTEPL